MPDHYKFKNLEIVTNLKVHEKILVEVVKFVGYCFGHLSLINHFTLKGLSISPKAYREQACSYLENGERVFRRLEAKDGLLVDFKGLKSIKEIFRDCVAAHKNRPCLGERKILKESKIVSQETGKPALKWTLSDFVWTSYSEVLEEVINIASHLRDLNLNQNRKIVFFADTCKNWMVMALSVMEVRSTFITLYVNLSDPSVEYCLTLTEPVAIFADHKTIHRVNAILPKIPSIKTIIFNPFKTDDAELSALKQREDVTFLMINDLKVPSHSSYSDRVDEPSLSDTVVLMFTSGSTGIPKGVEITNQMIVAIMGGVCHRDKFWSNKTYPAYLPLGHVLEFVAELAIISFGGKVGYCHSFTLLPNLPGLEDGCKSDLEILKPDVMIAVPLILEKIKKIAMSKIMQESRFKQLLFQTIYNMRAYYYSRGYDTPIINKIFFAKPRKLFGGNLEYGVIGGALVSPDTEEFINICFGTFKQAYGSTEVSAAGTFSEIDYYTPNNVGPPLGCLEIKLLSWEESGYFSDDPKHPRGEIAIQGLNVVSGYYKDPESTKESFFTDPATGKTWFYTGDIAEMMQDGTLRIIDRKKDIVKLMHGEYVPLAKIENIIMINKYVDICCVCPNSTNSNIIALIVPNRPDLVNLANKLKITYNNDVESLIQNEKIKSIIEEEIILELKSKNLSKYEFVSAIHLVKDTWTPESGLVTASMKLKRKEISKNYAQLLF